MKKIMFYRKNDEYGEFSNFSDHPITLDGTRWPTVEHYFQANKFNDDSLMFRIQMAQSPMDAALIGRDRGNTIRPDWEEIKVEVMTRAVEAKFRQNEDVRTILLSTGEALLIEHTENDSYWGDGGDGSGKNKLGLILMEVRRKLLSEMNLSLPSMAPPWELNKNEPIHSMYWRMGSGESYINEWSLWFISLGQEDKNDYIENNPEPKGWEGFFRRQ